MTRDEAVAFLVECRDIHAEWSAYLRDGGRADEPDPQGPVGCAESHDWYVERYNAVVFLLLAPDGYLTTDATLTAEQVAELKSKWDATRIGERPGVPA